jgi:Ca2+/Na+ antiporter
LVGIILGSIACVISLSAVFILLILRVRLRRHDAVSMPRHCEFLLTINLLLSLVSTDSSVKLLLVSMYHGQCRVNVTAS